jgi:RimJ/RimL family protein N-acetyltransferase
MPSSKPTGSKSKKKMIKNEPKGKKDEISKEGTNDRNSGKKFKRSFSKKPILYGEKTILSRTVPEHIEPLYKLIKSKGVLENLTIEIENLEEFQKYIRFIINQWTMNHDFTYTIMDKKKNLLGQVAIYNLSFIHYRGEIGIWLDPKYWKKGYAYDSLFHIVDFAFKGLKLNRLQAHIFESNTPSMALFEKVGFSNEGLNREYVKKNEKFIDVYLYSLLASTWNDKKNIEFQNNLVSSTLQK